MNDRVAEILGRMRAEFGRNCRQERDGMWRFETLTGSGRSHVVTLYVRERIDDGRDLSRFVAFAPIGIFRPDQNHELLLRKNAELDVGSIAVEDIWTKDNVRLPFIVFRATHLVVTADYPEVWELVVKTGEYADSLENAVFVRDFY